MFVHDCHGGVRDGPVIFFDMDCQRSGATSVESIFDASPQVRVIGEENWSAHEYFGAPEKLSGLSERFVWLRIPAAIHRIDHAVNRLPRARVLFTMRDPRDVVTSMRKLQMRNPVTGKSGSWLESCGHGEIDVCLRQLPRYDPLTDALQLVPEKTDDRNDVGFGAQASGQGPTKGRLSINAPGRPTSATTLRMNSVHCSC